MSFEDFSRGVRAGMEQDVLPQLAERDHAWYRACHEIISRCVAPDMYANAMDMLQRAMREASGAHRQVQSIPMGPDSVPIATDSGARE